MQQVTFLFHIRYIIIITVYSIVFHFETWPKITENVENIIYNKNGYTLYEITHYLFF